MGKLFSHFKTHILRGVIAMIPLGLSVVAIRFIYIGIDSKVIDVFDEVIGLAFPGLGILLLVLILYMIGVITSNVVGNRVLGMAERLTSRIPIIKTTYQVGKQLADTLSMTEKQAFKRPVLVDYLKTDIWIIGLVTGTVIDTENHDEKFLKVFIPTPPNPASGTVLIVKESDTRDPGWSIEETLKAVISGGIIGPREMGKKV